LGLLVCPVLTIARFLPFQLPKVFADRREMHPARADTDSQGTPIDGIPYRPHTEGGCKPARPWTRRFAHSMNSRHTLSLTLVFALATVAAAAETQAEHWAWQRPRRPPVPPVANAPGSPAIRHPIDAFIVERQRSAGLTLAPPADRATLIRRASYDLIGLPPTPEETDVFVRDTAADAWEKVIDRLLASPHYGERWGRHWLDLVRYADSNGFEHDEVRPDAWRYRDYVIRSLNADKPYDRFVTEQLAGDEAFPGDPDARIATGFCLLGPDMVDSADQPQRRLNTLADMTDTAGLAFLGLTITCARCHDHKFEPIPQTDYYRLQAFFAPAVFRHDLDIATPAEHEAHAAASREYDAHTKTLRDEIAAIEGPVRSRLFEAKVDKLKPEAREAHRTPPDKRNGGQQELVAETAGKVVVTPTEVTRAVPAEQRARLQALQKQLKNFDHLQPPPLPVTMGITDRPGPPPVTHLLERGDLAHPAGEVQPGYPVVLVSAAQSTSTAIASIGGSTGRRFALARWVANPGNPLTARVIVNRLWQHHFGRGLVSTPSDFGLRGERPTHPELLDWLADEFVAGGWQLKRMHKLMLMSQTYQQSTSGNPGTSDPENRLLSRMNRRRLDGEEVRDALLVMSGRLNPAMSGPGVVVPENAPGGGGAKALPVNPDPGERARRSVFLFARRNLRHPFLEAFDLPDSNLSCPRRERSTTAPQALALLNDADVMTAAKALGEKLEKESLIEDARIERAYRLSLGRPPTAMERDRSRAFLRDSPLSELCRALFNMNEFVYLD
jgi:hypothetical protein